MKIINKSLFKSVFILSTVLFLGCSEDEKQTVITKTRLVMQEEFDVNGAPNPELWNFDIGTGNNGWGNNEQQFYTDRPENIIVEDGMLKITARRELYLGSSFTSARITSKGKYEKKYGRIEARIKMPLGRGLWPAFWMLGSNIQTTEEIPDDPSTVPWPQCGEIDIVEYLGNNPINVFGTVHGPGYFGGESISKNYTLKTGRFDNEFHVYGIEWGENYINFYVDDALYHRVTPSDVPGEWVFNQPYYMILNMAVGGNLPGPPNDQTAFPQTMWVDYIRVYE